uniref:Fucolectin tachylectin-4 pentraxin-1 domain-containing protein n=1 Tax=Latimeria chalumnae TaxID=7897 RepID=H3AEU5_LATCH
AENVALKGTAMQSSKRDQLGVPEHAINGNKNSDFGYLSCTHTEHEMGPWWRVDLQQPYRISAVVITNRGDCCWERLRGAEIYIGNSLEKNGTLNPRCASISKIERGSTETICCKGMTGRYVTIAIPNRKEYLTLCEVEVYGVPVTNDDGLGTTLPPLCSCSMQANVALKGLATQSSLGDWRGVPEHAIDGNKNSVYGSLSCTHTRFEMGPWWRVDLQQPYRISAVVITNRGDCCWERLRGAELYIGNSLEKNGTLNPRCASISIVERGSTDSFCCNGMVGRYVTIAIPTRVEYLTLCEVEVYGIPDFFTIKTIQQNPKYALSDFLLTKFGLGGLLARTYLHSRLRAFVASVSQNNVALKGTATQSSKRDQLGVPEHAIDGNKNSDFGYLSCTHTEHEMGPWWRVDLQQPYRISAVVITNRGDCCWERLRGAEIYIGNSLEKNGTLNPRCASISSVAKGSTDSYCCNQLVGRYVTVAIPTREEYLTLCEVEVYGGLVGSACLRKPLSKPPPSKKIPFQIKLGKNVVVVWHSDAWTNVALKGTAVQSSLCDQGVPEHAIDGNRNSVYGSLSCTHTQYEMNPWWRVDLQQSHRISVVLITNRGDCCWERLKGAEIHIGNSLEKNGTLNHRCASVSEVERGSTEAFCCGELEGRYVTITIPGREEYMTLCEVEVYGVPKNLLNPLRRGDFKGKVANHGLTQNVALKGTATQSSKRDQLGVPERAIDGNKNSDFGYLSCTHTEHEMCPWWRVDLQQPYRISVVVITNRGDCCWECLRGAEIYIGNSLEMNGFHNPRCASISKVERGSTVTICCKGMVGRYVTIAIPNRKEYLTLCEVEVYGVPV